MQVFFKQKLTVLAVPKTGTTSYEMALRRRADIIFARGRKHMSAVRYHTHIAPLLDEMFNQHPETLAVIREPVDHLRSWYRYRSRDENAGTKYSTRGISFDAFIEDVLKDKPPPHARIGNQINVITFESGSLGVNHLFAYEAQDLLQDFLDRRFGQKIVRKTYNVSPRIPAPLDPGLEARLRRARADELALYQRVIEAGGHLHQARVKP